MRYNLRSKKIIGIVLIAILLITSNVYAVTDSFKTTLSVDNSQVKRGENITVTIALNDIQIESGEKGIGAYTANIDFDHSVLEYVSTKGTDKWEAPFYQDEQITGNTNDAEVVKTPQSIGTITFKVKDNAKLGETTIKLANFSGSIVSADISANDSSVKFTVIDNNTSSGNENNGSNGSTTGNGAGSGSTQNGGINNGGNKINVGNTNKENVKQGVLPQTGNANIGISILMVVCALVGMVLLIKIKLINKKIDKINN